jgi:gliding motility-associated-like protein
MLDQTICEGGSAEITLTGIAPYEIKFKTKKDGVWVGGDNTEGNATVFTRTLSAVEVSGGKASIASADHGVFEFHLVSVEDAKCINTGLTAIATVTVNALPTVNIQGLTNGKDTVCKDDAIDLIFSGRPPFVLDYTVEGHAPSYYHLPTVFKDNTDPTFDPNDENEVMLTSTGNGLYRGSVVAGEAGLFEFKLISLRDAYLNSCENDSAKTVHILVEELPTAEILEQAVCVNGSITVELGDSVTYLHIEFNKADPQSVGAGHLESPFYHNIPAGSFVIPVDSLSEIKDSTDAIYNYTIAINGVKCDNNTITGTIKINPKPAVTMSDTVVCIGDGVKIAFTGTPPFILEYEVEGNDPALIGLPASPLLVSGQDTTIVAGSAGDFEFRLISLTDNNSCVSTVDQTVNVKVHDRPTVKMLDLTDGKDTICLGDSKTLVFTGKAPYDLEFTSNGITYYKTNILTDTLLIPSLEAGTFNFVLVSLTDAYCSYDAAASTLTAEILVHALPDTPVITVNNVCYGDELIFKTGSGYAEYEWIDVINSVTVTTSDSVIKQTATGTYTYKVRVKNSNGCWSEYSDEASGTVDTLPAKPVIDLVGDVCFGETLTFVTESNYVSYYWIETNTNVISITQTPTIIQSLAGTYTYKVRVQNANGCWSEYSDEVSGEIYALPETPIINTVSDVCFGDTITFTATSGHLRYEWTEILTGTVTDTTINTMKVSAAGYYVYKVRVIDNNGCWSGYSNEKSGEVYELPDKPEIAAVDNVCFGNTLTFATAAGYNNYEWTETNSGTVTTGTNTVSETATGAYTYKVRVQNSNGCWSEYSDAVSGEIYAVPSKPVIAPVSDVCYGSTLTFATTAGYSNYEWTETNSGAVTLGTNSISQTNPGTYAYKVRVQNTNGCWSDYSEVVAGTVYPTLIIPVIEPSGTIAICEGSSLTLTATTGFANYTWYRNGTEISSGSENATIVSEAGKYTVNVTTAYGCGSGTSDEVTVEVIAYPAKPVITAEGLSDGKVWRRVGMNIVFEVSNRIDTLIYQWYHDGSIITGGQGEALYLSSLRLTDAGIYTVTATTQNAGCSTESDGATLIMRENIYVPRLVTPNNDNENDDLIIKGLEIYPHNELIIINRWGNEVFRTRDYVNGSWKGDNLPDGVYFYKLRLIEANGYTEDMTGYFHLKR